MVTTTRQSGEQEQCLTQESLADVNPSLRGSNLRLPGFCSFSALDRFSGSREDGFVLMSDLEDDR